MILEIENEIINSSDACLGLLFRASERLVEFRTRELVSGYFARLDYVSHFILEIGFMFASIEVNSTLIAFVNRN